MSGVGEMVYMRLAGMTYQEIADYYNLTYAEVYQKIGKEIKSLWREFYE